MFSHSPGLDSIAQDITEAGVVVDSAQHRLLSYLRVYDEHQGWRRQGAESCESWLSWRLGYGRAVARQQRALAHQLKQLPLIDEAFFRGRISHAKVAALVAVANPDNEAALVDTAVASTGFQIESLCAQWRASGKA